MYYLPLTVCQKMSSPTCCPPVSRQLTALLVEVLSGWKGRRPRLAYITDGGWHPEEYYRSTLRKMADPGRAAIRSGWQGA